MGLLYSLGAGKAPKDSPLAQWMERYATPSMIKCQEMEANGSNKPVEFLAANKVFEAYIDPENELQITDKLSQVWTLIHYSKSLVDCLTIWENGAGAGEIETEKVFEKNQVISESDLDGGARSGGPKWFVYSNLAWKTHLDIMTSTWYEILLVVYLTLEE